MQNDLNLLVVASRFSLTETDFDESEIDYFFNKQNISKEMFICCEQLSILKTLNISL